MRYVKHAMGGLNHCCYFHCLWSLNRKKIGVSKRVIEYPNPVNDCVHWWGWVPAVVSDLSSNSWGGSLNFGRNGKSLLQKTLEADYFGIREEMHVRYWWKGRSQSRAGGQSWVSAMWQKKQIIPQVLLGSRVTPLLRLPFGLWDQPYPGARSPSQLPGWTTSKLFFSDSGWAFC